MNTAIDDTKDVLTEWDNYAYDTPQYDNHKNTQETQHFPNSTDLLSTQALLQQINILNKKLHQAQEQITLEQTEKQNSIKLLKTKVNEIQNLHQKIKQMNDNIKAQQEHLGIEQNNFKTAKSKILFLINKLREAEKIIQSKNKIIHDLNNEHEETKRRAKILIEEFYKDKFSEDPMIQQFATFDEEFDGCFQEM